MMATFPLPKEGVAAWWRWGGSVGMWEGAEARIGQGARAKDMLKDI